jgi:hypothetical protein
LNLTAEAPVKLVPVIVTDAPTPALVGAKPVIVEDAISASTTLDPPG